jgi:ABC-type nitrate/sulfonate/bicarbonate transport system substrate-binding protein
MAACGDGDTDGSADSGAAGSTTVRVMMFGGQAYRLPVIIGQEEGFFADRGIEAEIVEQPTQLSPPQALAASDSDVSLLSVSSLGTAVQADAADIKYFCGGIEVLQQTVMGPVDSNLPAADDGATWEEVLKALEGKKVGIPVPVGTGLQVLIASAFEDAGVTDVTWVNVGGAASGTIAALENGAVDAALTTPTGTQHLVVEEAGKPLLYLPDGPPTYEVWGSGWIGTGEWLEENPDAATDFCAALGDAMEFIQDPANLEDASALLQEDTGIDPEVADLAITEAFDEYNTDLDPDVVAEALQAHHDMGIFKPTPEVTVDMVVDDHSG